METENQLSESGVYLIHNPSDRYTIKGPFMPCAIAVAILGEGAYGISGTPILFGWDEWLDSHGVKDLVEYVRENKSAVADALETVLIGGIRDREEVERALALMPPRDHASWLEKRHDAKRTSMNNIGARAKKIAERLRDPSAW